MKKTVSIVLILTLLTVFFCSNVSAATASPTVANYKRIEQTKNGVKIRVSGVQTNGYSEGFYARYGGTGTSFDIYNVCQTIITVTVTNDTSKTKYLTDMYIDLKYNDSDSGVSNLSWFAAPRDIENYGPDFNLSFTYSSGTLDFIPSAQWSFGNKLCIPANCSLNCVCVITFPCKFGTNDNTLGPWQDANLDSITIYPSWNAYDTDFTPQGAHDDLLISIEALRNYLNGSNGIPALIDSLDDILNEVTWNGTYNNPQFGNESEYTLTYPNDLLVRVTSYKGIPITDFEILPPDVVVTDVLYRIPVCVTLVNYNTNDRKLSGSFTINEVFSTSGCTVDSPRIYSSWIETVGYWISNGNYTVVIRPSEEIIAAGYNSSEVWFDVYSRNASLSIRNFTVTANISSYTSDLSTESDSLKNTSDSVHSQEQIYFAQNQQAIQATGLSNYQFSSADGSGISAVSNDFTTIWNALSGWNSVYIFSLTLGLALTILRHAPNAISRRRRKQQND